MYFYFVTENRKSFYLFCLRLNSKDIDHTKVTHRLKKISWTQATNIKHTSTTRMTSSPFVWIVMT